MRTKNCPAVRDIATEPYDRLTTSPDDGLAASLETLISVRGLAYFWPFKDLQNVAQWHLDKITFNRRDWSSIIQTAGRLGSSKYPMLRSARSETHFKL